MKVLIVDDNEMVCRCLETQIDWQGVGCSELAVAYDGQDAIRQIEVSKPDVVISDVRMPVMDGTELCKQIDARWPEIAIIFMSVYEDFTVARMAIRYNVKDYILKPLDRSSLDALEQILKNVVKQRTHVDFYQKIISNDYQEYLTAILEGRDKERLEEFMNKLAMLGSERETNNDKLWGCLVKPLFIYRSALHNQEASVLNQEERRANEEIMALSGKERIAYLRKCYQEVMKEKEEMRTRSIVGDIQKVVQEQFASTSLNIHKLGSIFQMSPAYLGRIYMESTGMSLVDYIAEKRIQNACKLLATSVKSIKEIAEACGYPDANYFSRVFKRKMNMTPAEYRTKNKKLDSKKLWEDDDQA